MEAKIREYQKAYQKQYRKNSLSYRKAWKEANKERIKAYKLSKLKKRMELYLKLKGIEVEIK